jgi:predicted RND superfamily exporter protein
MQKKREEKKAYEEAFNKLSNEERLIIRKVEAELKSVYDMDIINYYQYIHPEIKEKEKVQREKEEIKRLTKLIEDNRKKGNEYNKIIPIGAFIGLGVLAVITGI